MMRRLLLLTLAACGSHGHPISPNTNADDVGATPPDAAVEPEPEAAPPDAAPEAPPDAAPAALPDAKLTVAKPKVTGDVPADTARARLREHEGQLLGCYQRILAIHSDLAGKVDAYITVDDAGTVTNAQITGLDSSVDTCLASVIDMIEFPAPKKTSKAIIDATLTFAPK